MVAISHDPKYIDILREKFSKYFVFLLRSYPRNRRRCAEFHCVKINFVRLYCECQNNLSKISAIGDLKSK